MSNKVQKLHVIGNRIQQVLRVSSIELRPHERKILYITGKNIFIQTLTFRSEWFVKAEKIYQAHLAQMADPATHRGRE